MIKLFVQSAESWICIGKYITFEIVAIYFLKNEKTPDNWRFYSSGHATELLGYKEEK